MSATGSGTNGGRVGSRGGDGTTAADRARAFARRWLPYVALATCLFLATAIVGAAVGAERQSFIVPVRGRGDPVASLDAAGLFAHNAGIGLQIAAGAVLFGLPTVYLLSFNGFVFGATVADAAGTLGPLRALALVAPHGVLELPAIWLAGAVGLRWLHLVWRLASGGSSATGVPRAVLDSLAAVGLVLLLLAVAAVVEATVTVPLARALT